MTVFTSRIAIASVAAVALLAGSSTGALAQKKYDTGATDTEIKIGNIMPYSGPASAYGVIGKTEAAYFKMINDAGGINGRKINFISYDDSYSPPKTVEQARKLVESDDVLFIFNSLGTPPNTAIHKYMNSKKVPQLFVATGATKWNDPKDFPWTMGWQPSYQSESAHLRQIHSEREAQRQDCGALPERRLRQGLPEGPERRSRPEGRFDDRRRGKLRDYRTNHRQPPRQAQSVSGADIFVDISTPKFAAQAIKKAAEIEWKPLHFLNNVSANVGAVLKPAGYENSQGIISAAYVKDVTDPQWDNDPGMKQFLAFLAKDFPEANKLDNSVIVGYGFAQTMVQVLKQCGDDLTRANVMKQAANLKDFRTEVLLPGIKINTSPTNFAPINQLQLEVFKGERWVLFGDIISGDVSG